MPSERSKCPSSITQRQKGTGLLSGEGISSFLHCVRLVSCGLLGVVMKHKGPSPSGCWEVWNGITSSKQPALRAGVSHFLYGFPPGFYNTQLLVICAVGNQTVQGPVPQPAVGGQLAMNSRRNTVVYRSQQEQPQMAGDPRSLRTKMEWHVPQSWHGGPSHNGPKCSVGKLFEWAELQQIGQKRLMLWGFGHTKKWNFFFFFGWH